MVCINCVHDTVIAFTCHLDPLCNMRVPHWSVFYLRPHPFDFLPQFDTNGFVDGGKLSICKKFSAGQVLRLPGNQRMEEENDITISWICQLDGPYYPYHIIPYHAIPYHGQGRFNLMCGLQPGWHVWRFQPD